MYLFFWCVNAWVARKIPQNAAESEILSSCCFQIGIKRKRQANKQTSHESHGVWPRHFALCIQMMLEAPKRWQRWIWKRPHLRWKHWFGSVWVFRCLCMDAWSNQAYSLFPSPSKPFGHRLFLEWRATWLGCHVSIPDCCSESLIICLTVQ